MLPEIAQLYTAFDKVFPRPKSFEGEGCCVKKKHERPLLKLPREQLTEEMFALPGSHFGICFATFEQASYFIPRLLELLSEAEDGFAWGSLNMRIPSFLLEHKSDYTSLGLWQLIEDAYLAIFRERTSTFTVHHYDKAACVAKGWGLDYFDLVVGTDGIDDLLGWFFPPLLLKRVHPDGSSGWGEFFRIWAEDDNPARVAHLLDVTKRYLEYQDGEYRPPESYLERLKDAGYTKLLLARAESAVKSTESAIWLGDLRTLLQGVV